MRNYFISKSLLFIIFCSLNIPSLAATSLYFQSQDWLVVCDNTRTCRLSGYSNIETTEGAISVLITQKSGVDHQATGKVKISFLDDDIKPKSTAPQFPVQMMINNKNYGVVLINKETLEAPLSQKQTQSLIASLRRNVVISWNTKKHHWLLSDKGAAAVLLKTDEFQHRMGTAAALIKKGHKSTKNMIEPLPIPTIYAEEISDIKEVVLRASDKLALEKELVLDKENCFIPTGETHSLSIYQLTHDKLLASKLCWQGAYNTGFYFWVINKQRPFQPNLITEDSTSFYVSKAHIGIISSDFKWRGLGDCWSYKNFVWTGKTFVVSSKGSTGLCRYVAAGGAWDLPTFISQIKLNDLPK